MKRIVFLSIVFLNILYANNCRDILAEGDKYLQRVPLCDELSEKHANIARVYYERYEICTKQNVEQRNFTVNPLEEKSKPFECKNKAH